LTITRLRMSFASKLPVAGGRVRRNDTFLASREQLKSEKNIKARATGPVHALITQILRKKYSFSTFSMLTTAIPSRQREPPKNGLASKIPDFRLVSRQIQTKT
jgi:hypothetical protein